MQSRLLAILKNLPPRPHEASAPVEALGVGARYKAPNGSPSGGITDARIAGFAASQQDGFANWAVMWDEIRAMANEIKRYRERPAHCPGCDGDHL
jgi:hypothetical protein